MVFSRQTIHYHDYTVRRKSYGFFSFVGDVIMTLITGGFWLIWIFVREMRRR